jgi:hypothetical protein
MAAFEVPISKNYIGRFQNLYKKIIFNTNNFGFYRIRKYLNADTTKNQTFFSIRLDAKYLYKYFSSK